MTHQFAYAMQSQAMQSRYRNTKLSNEIVDLGCRAIKRIGEYRGTDSKIEWLCLRCTNHWFASPRNVVRQTGCPQCADSSPQMLTDEDIDRRLIGRSIYRVGVDLIIIPYTEKYHLLWFITQALVARRLTTMSLAHTLLSELGSAE